MVFRTARVSSRISVLVLLLVEGSPPARADSDSDWNRVAEAIGRKGDLKAGVYRAHSRLR
jgi:hypothetical protein